MKLDNQVIFVSGTNRGIGKAIVDVLLKRKVKKIYATARKLDQLPQWKDIRVVSMELDITSSQQIQQAVGRAQDVNVLINNAGALSTGSVLTAKDSDLMRDMQVNYFGTLNMVRVFEPVIEKNGLGAIINLSSVVGLASMAQAAGYSASKAAIFSASQALRAELKLKNISVHTVFPGPIDTDMARDFDFQKTSPAVAAENIIKGIEAGDEDIFPDPFSIQIGSSWSKDPKAVERSFAAM
jgi:NAD(P)-dependent dehydrogenase (short-subunit alcohol dehydrogenase family)